MSEQVSFHLDVSFAYRNIDGNAFNRSFATQQLTPAQLLNDVIKQGWQYFVASDEGKKAAIHLSFEA